MKLLYSPIIAAAALVLFLVAGCNSVYREEVRPVRSYSKSYFFHVVRYQGETLNLISRWYTGSETNSPELRRQNRYIADSSEELALNSRILIPRKLLQTMKLMPIGFIRKNSPDLEIELEEQPTATPQARKTEQATATASHTPTTKVAPSPTAEPTATPEPTVTPTSSPTSEPTNSRPKQPPAERNDFSDEDPSESPNSQIQIPQEIVEELKDMGQKAAPKVRPDPAPATGSEAPPGYEEPLSLPTQAPARQVPARPRYEEAPPYVEPEREPEAEISDERKKLLEMLRGQGASR